MSVRAANYPLEIPSGVEVNLNGGQITVKGKQGELMYSIHPTVTVQKTEKGLVFSLGSGNEEHKNFLGTVYVLIKNMLMGVSHGFQKKLELVGVGYRAQLNAGNLELNLGFSHPVVFPIPEGITITLEKPTILLIQGINKQMVGEVAAKIKAFRPVEPYKGKGVRYSDEIIKKKEVKKK